jgi:hypothetical protein
MATIKRKSVFTIIVLLVAIIFETTFYLIGKNERVSFIKSKINSKIISSSDPQKKSVDYYLPNDLKINVTIGEKIDLKVGDSIAKEAHSLEYKVYKKKDNGEYVFFKKYIQE